MPIFTGGANRANLRYSQASHDVAVAEYERAIQSAFRETADALADRGVMNARIASQTALVQASGDALRLSQARYRGGVDSYLAVLTSQQNNYAAQQSLVTARQAQLSNLVTLYRVLGGGWR